jgi:cell division protein FtsQ
MPRFREVSRDLDGNLNVTIKQNRPIARIIQSNSYQDVYIDAEGNILPLSERYTARVIPITRSATAPALTKGFFQDSTGSQYLALLHYIEQDPFWKAQLAGMHIDAKGRVSFLPQVGNQTIEFGKPVEIEKKFKKLLVFYAKIMPTIGWDTYKRVNIEFNNQIVCE